MFRRREILADFLFLAGYFCDSGACIGAFLRRITLYLSLGMGCAKHLRVLF
jgi:hypothetical protein